MIKTEEVYPIGRLGKPHGVKGEISFQFSDDIFDRTDTDYLVLQLDGILVPFFIEAYRMTGNETALLKFEDINTQEQARQLTGAAVFFPRHLADEDVEHLSWEQLVGLHLVDTHTNKVVGTICHVDDSTLNLLFEVEAPDGHQLLVPASADLIEGIDTKAQQVLMQLPQGLLDL